MQAPYGSNENNAYMDGFPGLLIEAVENSGGSNKSSRCPSVEASIDLLLVNKLPDVSGESIVFLTTSREPTLNRHDPLSPQSRYRSP